MAYQDPRSAGKLAARKIARKIAVSRFFLTVERLLRSHWPGFVLFGLILAGMLFSRGTELFSMVALGGGAVLLLVVYLRHGLYRRPTRDEAIARLDGGWDEMPMSAVHDVLPDNAGETTREIWFLHQKRSLETAKRVRPTAPNVRLALQDRWATRLMAVLLILLGVFFGRDVAQTISATTQGAATPRLRSAQVLKAGLNRQAILQSRHIT